jgi:acetyltransferase-like isoleucine patch superfamily enzyme
MIDKIKRRLRWAKLKLSGAKVDYGIQSFDNFFTGYAAGLECGNLYICQGSKIIVASHRGVLSCLKIGSEVYINHYSIIDCHHLIKIGDRVNIGPYCYIGDFDHDISLNGDDAFVQPEGVALPVVIENNVWLGAGVVVLKGVTIGEGAVVGAGSVVTKNVPANTVFAGNPARLIKSRPYLPNP